MYICIHLFKTKTLILAIPSWGEVSAIQSQFALPCWSSSEVTSHVPPAVWSQCPPISALYL